MKFRRSTPPTERIVAVVAVAAITQSILEAIQAQLDGSWPKFWLWLIGSAWIFSMAAWAETVKRRWEE